MRRRRAGYDRELGRKAKCLVQGREAAVCVLRNGQTLLMAQDPDIGIGQQFSGQPKVSLAYAAESDDENAAKQRKTFLGPSNQLHHFSQGETDNRLSVLVLLLPQPDGRHRHNWQCGAQWPWAQP